MTDNSLRERCSIINTGRSAWLFDEYAQKLSQTLKVRITQSPREFNYVLGLDEENASDFFNHYKTFVPYKGIVLASDKRVLYRAFMQKKIPIPKTHLLKSWNKVGAFLKARTATEWCLKYPTSCGGAGHRILTDAEQMPDHWPFPYIVQEFVRLENPKVYRTYGIGGSLFGWNVRYFPKGTKTSPWGAHARGARYKHFDKIPADIYPIAKTALLAANLLDSYGCVDLLQHPRGEWLVLEVGTDGIFTHVDCDLGDTEREALLFENIARAFFASAEKSLSII